MASPSPRAAPVTSATWPVRSNAGKSIDLPPMLSVLPSSLALATVVSCSGGFMRGFDFLKSIKSPEQRLAWMIALAADAIQIVALPLFAPGGFSPADTLLDLAVAGILLRLLGWHWAFLPTFAAELVPGLDL